MIDHLQYVNKCSGSARRAANGFSLPFAPNSLSDMISMRECRPCPWAGNLCRYRFKDGTFLERVAGKRAARISLAQGGPSSDAPFPEFSLKNFLCCQHEEGPHLQGHPQVLFGYSGKLPTPSYITGTLMNIVSPLSYHRLYREW